MDDDFERVALDLGGHRAAQHGAGLAVVGGWAEHQRGTMPCLFVPGLRRKLKPDNVARIRHKAACHYQTSLPTGSPVSKGLCWFLPVMPPNNLFSLYALRRTGSMTMRPCSSRTWTVREEQGRIVIEPVRRRAYKLNKLLGGITGKNQHKPFDTGEPVGKEVW